MLQKNQNKSGCDELPTWPFSGLEATQKDNDRQVSNKIANDKNVSAQFCGGPSWNFFIFTMTNNDQFKETTILHTVAD